MREQGTHPGPLPVLQLEEVAQQEGEERDNEQVHQREGRSQ